MIAAFLSYITSFLIFYSFKSFPLYALAMIFFAFGEAFRTGTHKAMILEHLKIHNLLDFKVHYYGHTRSASQFGSAISSLIAAALVFYTGNYQIIFIASVIPYIVDLILMITYPKELDSDIHVVSGTGTLSRILAQVNITLTEFTALFKQWFSFQAILNSSLFDSLFKTVKDYLQPVLKNYALLRQHYILSIFFFIIFYLVENIKKPMSVGYISEQISHRVMATGLSGESQLKTLFVALFSPPMGFLADHYSVSGGLITLSVIMIILFPLVALRQRKA